MPLHHSPRSELERALASTSMRAGEAVFPEITAHRPIRDAYDDLEKEIHALNECLGSLGEKLEPVLTPSVPHGEPANVKTPPEPCRSQVTQGLVTLARMVREARERVNNMRDRVEV